MSTAESTRTITPEMRRELLAAWDDMRWIVDAKEFWPTYPPETQQWFRLTINAFGTPLSGPMNVASGC